MQRILAIDDAPHMLKLLERIITEKTPYAITTTSNSLEIPKLLEAEQFELIISDLKMPGMDGIDILRHVRELKRTEEVIIMTAFGSLDSVIEALQQGAFDYITKPFKKEQIIFAVDRVMRWQEAKRTADSFRRLMGCMPLEKAHLEFEQEYLLNLRDQTNGDTAEMARISGLTEEDITKRLVQT